MPHLQVVLLFPINPHAELLLLATSSCSGALKAYNSACLSIILHFCFIFDSQTFNFSFKVWLYLLNLPFHIYALVISFGAGTVKL